jgi:hypothetical protein
LGRSRQHSRSPRCRARRLKLRACPLSGADLPLRRRDERRCQRPLPVGHITGITQSFSAMLLPSNTSPCHGSLHLSQDRLNHNLLVLLNNFRGGLLEPVPTRPVVPA